MSTDFSIRPVGAPAPLPVVQHQTQAASSAVQTQLPASQSVTAADGSATVRNDPQTAGLVALTHQAFYDQDASSMVYRVVNSATGEVVEQLPAREVLRRRAYLNALDKKGSLPRVIPTDVTA